MRAVWLVDVLTDAGITVHPYDGWETRGGTTFAPVGIIWHHTVTKASTADEVIDKFLATTGSSTTPAPLCNYSTNRDGSISVIAAGTANHGGKGGWNGQSGNRLFFGDEMKNLGTPREPWPERQLETARLAAAAILDHIRRDAGQLCSHEEYALPPGRKTDPHSLNMDTERARVAALMENGDDVASPADVMSIGDVNAAIDWNKAFGAMTQAKQQALMAKLVLIADNYPVDPPTTTPGDGLQRGDMVTLT